MLSLNRGIGKIITIGDNTSIKVLGIKGNQVRLGVNAPDDVTVHRSEVYERIQQEKKAKQAMDAGFSATNTEPLGTDKAVGLLKAYLAQGAEEVKSKEEGLAVIDLALGMQRIGAKTECDAIEVLGILFETLQVDIPLLQKAQQDNDIEGTRKVLHKIRGGLFYSGTPRLEEAFSLLHAEVKLTLELRKIADMFALVYHETKLFIAQFNELVGINKK